ncbi:MAG: U32 family peptidase [Bacilli bacterium]|nr:U32 family peptidase [Bacilli bacterium]
MKIEIMAPAKNIETFFVALDAGADSIYFGLHDYNARVVADNFSFEELKLAVSKAKEKGVKTYLTLNTLLKDEELDIVEDIAIKAIDAGIDALIVQDLGLAIRLASKKLPLIASTQMTICNHYGIKTIKDIGFYRVVLSRELNVNELKECSKNSDGVELECFIHGGLCISYSGQCNASIYYYNKSSNRGACQTPCWNVYSLYVNNELIRTGCLIRPKDMFGLEHLKELSDSGISAFKVQGRTRNTDYASSIVKLYKDYANMIAKNKPFVVKQDDIEYLKTKSKRGLMRGNLETTINKDFVVKVDDAIGYPLELKDKTLTFETGKKAKHLSMSFNSLDDIDVNKIDNVFYRFYIPYNCFKEENKEKISILKKKAPIYLIMPIIFERHIDIYNKVIDMVKEYRIDGISLANLGDLSLVDKLNIEFSTERTFNITNTASFDYLSKKGINTISVPFELCGYDKDSVVKSGIKLEETIYGRPILMQMKYCILNQSNECEPNCHKCENKQSWSLVGEHSFVASFDKSLTKTILRPIEVMHKPIENDLYEYHRLDIFDESVEEINSIAHKYLGDSK